MSWGDSPALRGAAGFRKSGVPLRRGTGTAVSRWNRMRPRTLAQAQAQARAAQLACIRTSLQGHPHGMGDAAPGRSFAWALNLFGVLWVNPQANKSERWWGWAVGLGTRVGVDMEVGEGVGMGVALRWK